MINKTDSNPFRFLCKILLMTFAISSVGFITACDDKGPAEEAGEAIDETVEDAGDAIEDATN
ncbi:hypothetical protein E8Q33_12130 [Methylophaga sp. SB9B]|uniref:hypothetical protein n=1 Tax=Methylophaga sp. SB9B TaxID=2570356 RepID=UPI0010A84FDE|nr:hypothetical protein [Methylophaga sp. SB9B]THK40793.1 hypothetical protein E8Q33_12130 [Methylophaga sp. SB9B]